MMRVLTLDLDVLLSVDSSAHFSEGDSRLDWLVDALRPYPDVRLTFLASHQWRDFELERLGLGDLASRVLVHTFNFPQRDSLENALRFNGQAVRQLVVVADTAAVPDWGFDVLVCDDGLGLSSLKSRTSIANWLARTCPIPRSASGARLPFGQGMLVIYLDFDGVLHHENVLRHHRRGIYAGPPGFVLFEHAALLEKLLAPFPLVRIVLSTSWVRVLGYGRSVKRLPPALRERVIGATFHSEMSKHWFAQKTRGMQVVEDVARRRPLDWLALDDTDEGWPAEIRRHVLLTDERLGIAAPGFQDRLSEALERMR